MWWYLAMFWRVSNCIFIVVFRPCLSLRPTPLCLWYLRHKIYESPATEIYSVLANQKAVLWFRRDSRDTRPSWEDVAMMSDWKSWQISYALDWPPDFNDRIRLVAVRLLLQMLNTQAGVEFAPAAPSHSTLSPLHYPLPIRLLRREHCIRRYGEAKVKIKVRVRRDERGICKFYEDLKKTRGKRKIKELVE